MSLEMHRQRLDAPSPKMKAADAATVQQPSDSCILPRVLHLHFVSRRSIFVLSVPAASLENPDRMRSCNNIARAGSRYNSCDSNDLTLR